MKNTRRFYTPSCVQNATVSVRSSCGQIPPPPLFRVNFFGICITLWSSWFENDIIRQNYFVSCQPGQQPVDMLLKLLSQLNFMFATRANRRRGSPVPFFMPKFMQTLNQFKIKTIETYQSLVV